MQAHDPSQSRVKNRAPKNNSKQNSKSRASSIAPSIKTTVARRGDGSTVELDSCQVSTATCQLNNGPAVQVCGCWPGYDCSYCSANVPGTVANLQTIDLLGIGCQFDGVNADPTVSDGKLEMGDYF